MINFKTYDKDNPQIWKEFKKYAFEAKAKGFSKYSANGIFEIIRWNTTLEHRDKYKVNNNYRPDYARKMMKTFPEFNGFFTTRVLKAKRN
tara:strand:- start:525 stop:794 length:270 start_codon:yes stop_codon:yes gene_type:complete